MSRYIHFLCLLFINLVFCYDYLDVNPRYRPVHRIIKSSRDKVVDAVENSNQNAEINDKDEVAELDVANFIQGADYDKLGNNNQFEDQYKRENPSNKNSFDSLVDASLEEYEDNNQDYDNMDALEENAYNVKSNPHQQVLSPQHGGKLSNLRNNKEIKKYYNDNTNRYLQKKCAFKNMKIPFFSHDSTKARLDTALDVTMKKNKKRKLFNFNSKKHKPVTSQLQTTSLTSSTIKSTDNNYLKLKKRSYLEKICPLCKRKFIVKRKQEDKQSDNIIHNSRQYYQVKENLDDNYNDNSEMKRMLQDTDPENLMKKNKILDRAYD